MNSAILIALLQAAASLLTTVKAHPHSPIAQNAVYLAGNVVQIATQATANIPFAVTPNDGIWPNAKDTLHAAYRDSAGNWVRQGRSATLLPEYTSFGDLNHDGIDDAAVIVAKPGSGGSRNYFLTALLNQGGVMFDIAEFPLGETLNLNSHHVVSGVIVNDKKQYELWGNTLRRTH